MLSESCLFQRQNLLFFMRLFLVKISISSEVILALSNIFALFAAFYVL